jgi:cytoskeletal protein CcmA (bactofilin family)
MWRKDEPQAPSLPAQTKSTPSTSVTTSAGFDQVRSAAPPSSAPVEGWLTRSLIVEGEITGQDDLLIDCQLRGKIRLHGGKLTVGPDGRVSADIEAREVVVRGEVTGSIKGHERVRITATGKAKGEISTRSISIEEGAEVHGLRVNLEKEGQARSAAVTAADSRPAGKPQVPMATEPSQVHL